MIIKTKSNTWSETQRMSFFPIHLKIKVKNELQYSEEVSLVLNQIKDWRNFFQ